MTAPTDAAALASLLARGSVDCLPADELQRKCELGVAQQRPLRVKLGIDPTAPDIHLGHAVLLRKLRAFQDVGHRVVLIIGDYTARVGDPSGRSALRPVLSGEQVEANAKTFQEQALRILDGDPALLEVRSNSEWLDMPLVELLELLKTTTVAQMTERDDFAKRLRSGVPLSMLELLYPLLQGFDSVAVHADIELGGTDQKFNLLLGRDIQRAYGQPEQAVMTMPILPGTDGQRKMSKSYGNQIGITDEPATMYGKTMSIPDNVMGQYYELLLGRVLPTELSARDAKHQLALGIVALLHGDEAAAQAAARFEREVIQGGLPEEIDELPLPKGAGDVHLPALIADALALSRSQVRRMIDQGAVNLDGKPILAYDLPAEELDGRVLQVGKRRYLRLRQDSRPR